MTTPGVAVFVLNAPLKGDDLDNVIEAMESAKNEVILTEVVRYDDGRPDEVKILIKGLTVNL